MTRSTTVFPSSEDRPEISADLLVKAIFNAHERHKVAPLEERTFTLSHAYIHGRVDLANLFRGRQEGLIGLYFIDCHFADEIDLTGSTLLGLRFQKCGLRVVTAEACKVFGQVEFEQVFSSEPDDNRTGIVARDTWYGKDRGPMTGAFDPDHGDENAPENASVIEGVAAQGMCRLNFHNADLDQSFVIKRSLLCGPPPRAHIDTTNTILEYAVSLGNACIAKSVNIYEGSAVLGGVSVAASRIGANLFLASSKLIAGEGSALNAQQARISGFVGLRDVKPQDKSAVRFEAKGLVDFLNSEIDGALDIAGAALIAEERNHLVALELSNSRIRSLQASSNGLQTDIRGQIQAINCIVAGTINLQTILVRPRRIARPNEAEATPEHDEVLLANFSGCNVGGSLFLSGEWRGSVTLSECKVETSINLGFSNGLTLMSPPKAVNALMLNASRASVGLDLGTLTVDSEDSWGAMRKTLSTRKPVACRVTPLSFAKDAELWEFQVSFRGRKHFGEAIRVGRHFQLLEGAGKAFFPAFRRGDLLLETDEQKKDYLRVFCGTLMADAGHFRIVEPDDWTYQQLPDFGREAIEPLTLMTAEELKEAKRGNCLFGAHASIWYGESLFRSKFVVHRRNHVVEMLDEEELHSDLPTMTWPAQPLYFTEEAVATFSDDWPRAPLLATEHRFEKMPRRAKRAFVKERGVTEDTFRLRPTIGLRNSHVGKLTDNHGNKWPKTVRLDLSGFTYDALEMPDPRPKVVGRKKARHMQRETRRKSPGLFWLIWAVVFGLIGYAALMFIEGALDAAMTRDYGWMVQWSIFLCALVILARSVRHMEPLRDGARPWKKRKRWLKLQFYDYRPTRMEFNPQPMEQLAQVMRHQGDEEGFRRISRLKARWQNGTQTNILLRPFIWMFGVAFGYGFSIYRSLSTFILMVALGVMGTHMALSRDVLVLNTSPDSAFIQGGRPAIPNEPCRNEILPILFALDKFVPLIELGQERLCRVRADMTQAPEVPTWSRSFLDTPRFWQLAGSIYKLLGWIVSSMLVLTFSKTLRRSTGE
ncbi:hypothetical protein [Roseovarius pelagicus]|uniref:Pentapeptide repeat-containing protein n=1 Tax=Roseovarius pelagicus TaxID=2980108 RepID=A0ABY6DC86_9RHOB|nr:hypothetical protein [Roseovarius pelagicus]UXX83695.1 hypothetical protein N7U68_03215 [Roseovarius pelagicus]